MDQVTKLVSLGQKWVRLGNFCWVYLWVTCLSELCDATGTKLIPQFWLLWILSPSMISQPIPPPSAKAGSIWRAAIQSTFCHPCSTTLCQPLSTWIHSHHQQHLVISLNTPWLWNLSLSAAECHPVEYGHNGCHCFSSHIVSGFLAWYCDSYLSCLLFGWAHNRLRLSYSLHAHWSISSIYSGGIELSPRLATILNLQVPGLAYSWMTVHKQFSLSPPLAHRLLACDKQWCCCGPMENP